uniref:Uncharacterized protein n=1 Tax=mine drainage metagenome TaxID=410659 RepID=E6PK95_9ZZZZ
MVTCSVTSTFCNNSVHAPSLINKESSERQGIGKLRKELLAFILLVFSHMYASADARSPNSNMQDLESVVDHRPKPLINDQLPTELLSQGHPLIN